MKKKSAEDMEEASGPAAGTHGGVRPHVVQKLVMPTTR